MKVLIVSFDKTLTEDIKAALGDHEVYVAKNSEEAIKMIPSDIEGVIYDAISGAISEEDINTLYTKKFSNARYVILYDELFPVDENNIVVSQKLLIPREEPPKEVVKKLLEFPAQETVQEAGATPTMEESIEEVAQEIGEEIPEFEIESTSYESASYQEETMGKEDIEDLSQSVEEALQEIEAAGDMEESLPVEESIQELEESVPTEELVVEDTSLPEETYTEKPLQEQEDVQEQQPTSQAVTGSGKILIVSFDQMLIDSIKAAFGQTNEVVSVKTVKQAFEQGKDASVIVFDAISGVIAEKGLIELANDERMSQKTYIILVDDLFPINVDGIPLENKASLSRDTDPSKIKGVIEKHLSVAPAISSQATQKTEEPEEEPVATAIEETSVVEESVPDLEISEEVAQEGSIEEVVQEIESQLPKEMPEMEIEPVQEEVSQEDYQAPEEESIPALEALEKVIEEQELEVEEVEEEQQPLEEVVEQSAFSPEEQPPAVAETMPSVSISSDMMDKLVESAVAKALSEDKIKEAVSRALEERMLDIRDMVSDVVRREVEKVFDELDIRNLIRQATYQALKDRLEELIT